MRDRIKLFLNMLLLLLLLVIASAWLAQSHQAWRSKVITIERPSLRFNTRLNIIIIFIFSYCYYFDNHFSQNVIITRLLHTVWAYKSTQWSWCGWIMGRKKVDAHQNENDQFNMITHVGMTGSTFRHTLLPHTREQDVKVHSFQICTYKYEN